MVWYRLYQCINFTNRKASTWVYGVLQMHLQLLHSDIRGITPCFALNFWERENSGSIHSCVDRIVSMLIFWNVSGLVIKSINDENAIWLIHFVHFCTWTVPVNRGRGGFVARRIISGRSVYNINWFFLSSLRCTSGSSFLLKLCAVVIHQNISSSLVVSELRFFK